MKKFSDQDLKQNPAIYQKVDNYCNSRLNSIKELMAEYDIRFDAEIADRNLSLSLHDHLFLNFYRDMETFGDSSLKTIENLSALLSGENWIVADKNYCNEVESDKYSSTPYLLDFQGEQNLNPVYSTAIKEAMDLLESMGYGDFTKKYAKIIIALDNRKREKLKHHSSFSIVDLNGTIFTDFVDDKVIMAETILHESIHTFTNLYLKANKIQLPEDPSWYSPWTKSLRPAFGILHSWIVFENLLDFLKSATETLTESYSIQYCHSRVKAIESNLIAHEKTIKECIQQVFSFDQRSQYLISQWSN